MPGRRLFDWLIWPALIAASLWLWQFGWGWAVLLWVIVVGGWFGYLALAAARLARQAAPSPYALVLERALLVGRDLIDHDPIFSKVEAAYSDGTSTYASNYRRDRIDFWVRQGLALTWGFVKADDDGVQYMPWGTDPALRRCTVLVLKVELAEALLNAGVPAADAAAEVNAAIGPPNLGLMGWGSIRTPGGRRTAKHWWHQYQSAVWESSATSPPRPLSG